ARAQRGGPSARIAARLPSTDPSSTQIASHARPAIAASISAARGPIDPASSRTGITIESASVMGARVLAGAGAIAKIAPRPPRLRRYADRSPFLRAAPEGPETRRRALGRDLHRS